MEAPIEVLRIDQSTVSKEISRFRPCDDETRCFYCRDWAQFIYKKHFVWAAKTQEEVLSQETIIKAGPYELSFLDQDVVPKERATKLAKRFEKLLSKDQARAIDIFEACHLWTKLPSTFSGLPDMFDRIEFNPFPDAIPLTDDPSDPAHLLDPLVIERLSLCLPSDSFHLLKNLTGDILLSHTQPTCDHMKPESKSPAELEVDRIIFNENSVDTINIALKELELALDRAWAPLYLFLEKMEQHEHRRSRLMGSECKTEMDEFVKNQNYTPFVDYWSKNASLFKKKKGVSAADELKNIDKMVEDRLSELQAKGEQFVSEFAVPRLEQIQVLTSDLWKLMVPTFAEMGKRMEKISLEKGGDQPKKLFKQPSQITLDEVDSTKEVKKAKELFIKELRKRIVVHNKEIEELSAYYYEARPELSARVDKLNNKEFKKRVKKVESGYYSIRQFYLEQIVSNLFPDSLFCKCVLYCLEPLMQEGEVMEAMTIEKEIKRFIETHSKMLMNRCQLQDSFEEGVQIGRSELAGILGKLFLKEGMRIQGETLALKRQNTLLKSMGVSETESTQKKKSKKKKGNSSTGPSTPSNPAESPSTPTKQIQEEKPAAPPPLSRAERLRLVVSGTRTSEQKVKDEPKVEKKDSSNEAEENVNVEKKATKAEETKPSKEKAANAVKKEEPKVENKVETTDTKKQESVPTKKKVPKALKKEEPKPVKKEEPKVMKKEEPKPVKKEEPKPVKKEEPKIVKKEEPKLVKKEEPKLVKKEEPKPVKKEESKPVKKEEPKPVKKEEPKPVKKEELKSVKKEESKPVKKEEPKIVKKEEPKPVEKNKPKVVKKEGPKVVKKEEPKIVKKEEPKAVKKEEPMLAKKEEAKPAEKEPKPMKEDYSKPQKDTIPQPSDIEQKRTSAPEKNSKAINHNVVKEESEASTNIVESNGSRPLKVNQESVVGEVKNSSKDTPRVFENENLKIVWSDPLPSEPKENAIQDWDDMKKSVIDNKMAVQDTWKNTEKEPESWNDVVKGVIDEPVLSWNALRSEVAGSPVKNSAAQVTQESTENTWASPKSVNQIGTPVDAAQDGWTTVSRKTVSSDIIGQGTFSVLNNTTTDGWSTTSVSPITSANNAWTSIGQSNKPTTDSSSNGWSNNEVKSMESNLNLGGWGSPSSTNAWERPAKADTTSWERKPSASNSTTSSPNAWDKKATTSPSTTWDRQSNTSVSNAPTKWVNKSATPSRWENKSTPDNANWTNDKLPWLDDGVDTNTISKENTPLKSASNSPGLNMSDKPPGLSQEPSSVSSNTSQPPGLSQEPSPLFNNSNQPSVLPQEPSPSFSSPNQPPGLSKDPLGTLNKPPGLSSSLGAPLESTGNPINMSAGSTFPTSLNSMNTPMNNQMNNQMNNLMNNPMNNPMSNPMGNQQSLPMSLSQPGVAVPPSLNMMSTLSMPFMTMPNMSYHAPLPDRMDEMDTNSLSLLVRNLHQQNGQLIQSVHSMQQDMSMMTTHYTDVASRTREKEAQTLQLFESRRKTEMDEARRYVEQLESRLQQLEEQSKNGSDHVLGGGFGNQDIFAGYRDEMGTNEHRPYNSYRKKTWSKSALIRCGNCGKTGHESNACRSFCRYCGSSDHLSDVCPDNN